MGRMAPDEHMAPCRVLRVTLNDGAGGQHVRSMLHAAFDVDMALRFNWTPML